jgi:hypothetical protein
LNTLRKEGFARVYRKRKGYALRCSSNLRETPLKILAERKECTEETVSPYYKLKGESVNCQEVMRTFTEEHRETGNLEGFQAKQSHIKVYEELCKECRRSLRKT